MQYLTKLVTISGQRITRTMREARLVRAWLLPLLLTMTGCHAPSVPQSDPPLAALRSTFRPTYDDARDRIDASLSPLVVVRFSDVWLIKARTVVDRAKGIPRKYHLLHRTAHVPLVLFLKLQGHFGAPLGPDTARELREYRQLVVAAREDLGKYRFTNDEIAWQDTILLVSSDFLEGLTEDSIITSDAFTDYRKRAQIPMMALADRAGEAQVDSLHAAMQGFRKKLTEEEWKGLRVLIIGPRQPRRDYAATQYFAALFTESGNTPYPGESERLFYVESPFIDRNDESFEYERRTIASMILDQAASEVFFDDPYRLSTDIAADGARKRIAELGLAGLRSDSSSGSGLSFGHPQQ